MKCSCSLLYLRIVSITVDEFINKLLSSTLYKPFNSVLYKAKTISTTTHFCSHHFTNIRCSAQYRVDAVVWYVDVSNGQDRKQ